MECHMECLTLEENCCLKFATFRSRMEGRSPSASGPLYSSSNSYNDASALGTTAELLDWAQRWVPRSLEQPGVKPLPIINHHIVHGCSW